MDTDQNQGNSSATSRLAPAPPAESSAASASASAEPLLTSVSRFAQQSQENQEKLLTLMNQVTEHLQTTDANVERSNAQIEKLAGWIKYNRGWHS